MSGFRMTAGRASARVTAQQRAALKAQELRTEIVTSLSQPGQGRTYTHYMRTVKGNVVAGKKRNKPHTASAPGDAPATDTRRLKQSIGVKKLGEGRYRVGTNVVYAPLLEFGTRKMAARPFFRPAMEKVKSRG